MKEETAKAFEEFWQEKRAGLVSVGITSHLPTIKTVCYLAWISGAHNELRDVIKEIKKSYKPVPIQRAKKKVTKRKKR